MRRPSRGPSLQAAREALLLFNEKAERLDRTALVRRLRVKSTFSLTATYTRRGMSVKATKVSDDPVDAFLLTLRFFIQDNEACSFRRLSKLYPTLPVPQDLREQFEKIRDALNKHLDSPSAIGILLRGMARSLTRRDVLHAFMWGDRAHANSPDDRALHRVLRKDPLSGPLATQQFVALLWELAQVIGLVRDLNLKVLPHLDAAITNQAPLK